ncbi:MAG: DNA translocase FtsK 4TM domain-containing protein [Candidatus Dormibacteraeota bacterium]|nr:DNA translocase FtsK 4TM domain-containing protein [Candidatus Dormibacteraeota bacterium]MBV9525876.1 DNA translocase FtsK 4TM domain-containing protein [Candidatus Dormibacteraeota bacterium]
MARSTSTKRRPAARPAPRRPRATPARGRVSRTPLFSESLRRELVGVGAIGLGLVVAAVLALPGGGAVAGPVHDALYNVLGIGAWLAVAGLAVTGIRLVATAHWRTGEAAAAGSFVAVLSLLGLTGLVSPGSAGDVGRWLGPGIAHGLGRAGAGALLIALAVIGLVMATDLRVWPMVQAAAAWLARLRESSPQEQERSQPRRFNPPQAGTVAELPGIPVQLPFEAPQSVTLPPEAFFPDAKPPLVEEDAPVEDVAEPEGIAFPRQFEGVVSPPPELGPVPELTAAHAAEASGAEEQEKVWVLPAADLLDTVTGKRERLQAEVRVTGDKIVSTLQSFGIETRIVGANSGPTVTQYELQPAVGVPVRKILGYQTDLALALAAPIRIQPFIPGKSAIGVEVPNKAAQLVSLKEIVSSSPFADARNRLSVALGADVSGHPVVGDITRMPHLLIAGATGSGKSVCINAILGGFLLQATPAQLKLILIDPKRVELSNFGDLPHLLVPVVVEPEAAVASLRWAVKEMEERYKLFASHGARNIAVFNERASGLGLAPLPYIVIVVDELADLMMVAAGEIEDLICRIAQLARAVGIHLVVATQRPSADIITGLIKANIPSRIAFAVSSGVDSRVILDEMGAEKLLGRGDMLYLPIDEGKPRRLQGAYVSDRELDALIGHWKAQGLPEYQEEIFSVEATVSWAKEATKRDPLFAKAAHTVAAEGRAAASLLQRKLNVGYTRAARLVDQLAEHGVVGPYEGSKSREVRMDVFQVDELLESLGEE